MDLGNNGLGKLLLLALLDLVLVTHPRLEDRLGLISEGSALLELVGLGLELGGFLKRIVNTDPSINIRDRVSLPWKQRTAAW